MNSLVAAALCLLFGMDELNRQTPGNDHSIILSSHPVENSPEIKLRLVSAPANNSISIPLFLRQSGMEVISDVRLVGQLTAQDGGPVPKVAFTAVLNTAAAPPWSVPPAGKQWLLNMTISDLTADGLYVGAVYIERAGTLHQLTALTVEKRPGPELAIVGIEANNKSMTLRSNVPTVALPVQIESRNLTPVRDLQLEATRFTDSEGHTIVPKWFVNEQPLARKEYEVSARGVLHLQMLAEFPVPGTYKGTLSLSYKDKRETVEFVVNRERVVLPVEIHGPARAEAVIGWYGHGPTVWLGLQETLGHEVVVNLPQIAMLTAKSMTKDHQVPFQKVTVRGDDGREITEDIKLQAGELKRVELELENMTEPGELTALVRVTSAVHSPRDFTVTLMTKEPVLYAGAWILAGVGLSLWLKHYRGALRPRLQAQQRAARLRRTLEKTATDAAAIPDSGLLTTWQELTGKFGDRLDRIDLHLIDGASAEIDGGMAEMEQKLPLILPAILAELRIAVVAPPEVRKEFEDRLKSLWEFLGNGTADPTQLKTDTEWLNKLGSAIESRVNEELEGQLVAFNSEVSKADLPEGVRVSLLNDGDAVRILMRQSGRLPEACEKMAGARRMLLTETIKAWNDTASAASPPPGFRKAEWVHDRKKTAQELSEIKNLSKEELDFAIPRCQRILDEYYRKLTDRLALAAGDLKEQIDTPSPSRLTAEMKKELHDKLESEVIQAMSLESIKVDFESHDYASIVQKYESAAKSFKAVKTELNSSENETRLEAASMTVGGLLDNQAAVLWLPSGGFAEIRYAEGEQIDVKRPRPWTVAEIDLRAKIYHWGAQALVAGVAVLLGTQWIWAGSPTWGSWSDYVTALLLGLGVHQVGGQKLNLDSLLAQNA